ncbi:MAG: FISUMP domain-containing protein, partial [Prolixibacteraceae bacterium]|nr:FISUMP domain-containing protein [Prolixibacteraceae bacterium]
LEEESGEWPRDTETAVVDVTNPATGKTWMDRNLGASRAAASSTDNQAYGDLYQWGRAADGHEKRNSPTTSTRSSSDTPGHGNFITTSSSPYDWRSPQNGNLWQGVDGVNNPCPSGYRLPTGAEWDAELNSWGSNNAAGAFASPLKLPMAGSRLNNSGSLYTVGSFGYCWSSTVVGDGSQGLYFYNSTAGPFNGDRAGGLSVRCIKD